ncbi:MAG TPA: TonB C-terminal domain-containing protein [Methylomirabilota bacterium]|nr:TonB C-terminal domain-containing protein [Methylomirabilota bacterium]
MGLWEFLQQWPRGRIVAGIVASLLIHVLVAVGLLWGLAPGLAPKWTPKPGDALIVELPRPDEPASAGSPSAPSPPPRSPAPAESKPPATPAPRRSPPPPREERRVASAPRAPESAASTPRAPEPPQPAEPAPRVAEPAPREADPAPPAPAPAAPESAPRAPVAPSAPPQGGDRQIASLPPAEPSASESLAALRRGAGGRGEGRGGIVGDPIPLDTPDPRFQEYFEQVRRRIQDKLNYPCIKKRDTFECEYKTTALVLHFGILRNGNVQFIELYRASEWSIYDEYSMNAVRLAQPFPPVPPALMASLPPGSTGVPIAGIFRFRLSLRSILQ